MSSNASFKKEGNKLKCHFCRKMGHFQKDCLKSKAWFEKKCMNHTFITLESNFIDVPNNTWWIDSGSTTHISNNLQGFLTIQTTSQSRQSERYVIMGNKDKVPVEGVGTYRLILDSGNIINLYDALYVPLFSHNLLSVSKLDDCG
jgi:Zinc knuckle